MLNLGISVVYFARVPGLTIVLAQYIALIIGIVFNNIYSDCSVHGLNGTEFIQQAAFWSSYRVGVAHT